MEKFVFWFSFTLFFHGFKDAGIVKDISLFGINWELTGKNARFDQSSPEQNDHLALLIVKKILWSTKIGRGWSRTPVFPVIGSKVVKNLRIPSHRERSHFLFAKKISIRF